MVLFRWTWTLESFPKRSVECGVRVGDSSTLSLCEFVYVFLFS